MAKRASSRLLWSPERGLYELCDQDSGVCLPVYTADAHWFAWLEAHIGFAFHGKHGGLTLRKESRPRGSAYWYAFRRQGPRVVKRYLGRTADLTIARLEATAEALNAAASPKPAVLAAAAARPPSHGSIAAHPHVHGSEPAPLAPVDHGQPLIQPKLRPPRLPAALVLRVLLLARLDAGLEQPLTLITAPAGFGKTTLVGQWLDQKVKDKRQKAKNAADPMETLLPFNFCLLPSQVAWVSLDRTAAAIPDRFPRLLGYGYQYTSLAIIPDDDGAPTPPNPLGLDGRPGTRAPHVWVEEQGRRISTLDLFGRSFVLLAGPDGAA